MASLLALKRSRRFLALALGTALLVGIAGSLPAQEETDPRLDQAIQLLQQNANEDALRLLDTIIEEQQGNAVAHLYRGLAVGRLGDQLEAQHAFLLSANFVPGNPTAHRFAAIASYHVGDYERSWEQALLAARSGADMRDAFALFQQQASMPSDWRERLDAPLIFVEAPDFSGVLYGSSFGVQPRVGGRDAPPDADELSNTEAAVTLGDIPFNVSDDSTGGSATSGADWGDTAAARLAANQAQIGEMMRQFRTALAHGISLGLAYRPEAAAYRMRIEVLELTGAMAGRLVGCELLPDGAGMLQDSDVDTDIYEAYHPKSLKGRLTLRNSYGAEVYTVPLEMQDIASLADLRARIQRYVSELELVVAGDQDSF